MESRAAAAKCKADDRPRQALRVVTLGNIKISKELFVVYGMKYWFQYSTVRDI